MKNNNHLVIPGKSIMKTMKLLGQGVMLYN